MFLKKLFYASASILMLALAYHLGASTATAQSPGNSVVGVAGDANGVCAITSNGDFYKMGWGGAMVWGHAGNIFGAPVPTTPTTFGALKARYR